MSDGKSQIKIRFFTREKDESLQVQDTPMYVPIQLKRYGLSEIVNHLLSTERSDEDVATTPFDFLIDGQLLRSSLDDYLVKNGLSSEVSLDIEYTRAVLPPSYLSSFSNEDWISSIDVTSGIEVPQRSIITGSYDGIVRTWNLSGQVEKMYSGHSAPIRAVKFLSNTRIVSAGNDRTLRIWKTKNSPVGATNNHEDMDDELAVEEGKTLAILEGHGAPVVSLEVSNETSTIISAS